MKNRILTGAIILLAFSVLPFSTLTLASEEDKDISTIQGPIMSINFNKNTMVVNEKTFLWNKNTIFYDDKESIIVKDKFKPKSWVFIEGEKGDKYIIIKKVYLLPKYVGKTERHLYPFMK